MEKHNEDEDAARWNVLVHKEDEQNIPHYIPIRTKKGDEELEDLWFVSKKGRTLECFRCKETGHWPAECRSKRGNISTRRPAWRKTTQTENPSYRKSFADTVRANTVTSKNDQTLVNKIKEIRNKGDTKNE